jgi:hypothetical protein
MKQLEEAVVAALESVHRLRTRLAPVLQPANPCPAMDSPDECPTPCTPTLSQSIGKQVNLVAAITDQVEDILTRLEL